MTNYIIEHEAMLRSAAFMLVFAVMAGWEVWRPCRPLTVRKSQRWSNNLAIVILNSLLLRFLFPTAALGVALFAGVNNLGLLNQIVLPGFLEIFLAVVVMDFMIYWQHLVAHAVPMFWRFHRMHHCDLDFDVTTGARFHPLEMVLSMLFKFLVIVLIGAPVVAVFLFEVILNAAAMFNHSNISLPKSVDRWLRMVVVTPDMHRVHHSVVASELNSNYGFNLSIWDRLFATYCDQPAEGQLGMRIGLSSIRDTADCIALPGMLTLPFRK